MPKHSAPLAEAMLTAFGSLARILRRSASSAARRREFSRTSRISRPIALAISAVLVLSLTAVVPVAGIATAPQAEAAEAAQVGRVSENAPAAAAPSAEAAFAPKAQAAAAASGCIPDPGYTNCTAFSYSGGDQTFTVPSNITSLKMKAWGAGGGGVDANYSKDEAGGGGGGYTTGTLAVTPGQSLTVVVGQGGRSGSNGSTARTYGGGGAGGSQNGNGTIASDGGSGGGYSAIFVAATKQATDSRLISAGGGGAAPGVASANATPATGGGGGTSGGASTLTTTSGRGGTSSGGANAGYITNCSNVGDGGQLQGGDGGSVSGTSGSNPNEGGGGGGGGYGGGGGGRCHKGGFNAANEASGSGGGGSSRITGTGLTFASTTAGTNGIYGTPGTQGSAGNNGDSQYVAGVGVGGSVIVAGGGNGGNGLVVFQWSLGYTIAKSASAFSVTPGATLTYSLTITNTSGNPYTASSKAGFSDDLSGVLDDATYNGNAASTVAGWTFSGSNPLVGSGPLAVGQSATITYSITVKPPNSGNNSLNNTITPTKAEGSCGASCGTSTPVITAATTCAAAAALPNGSLEAPVVPAGAGTNIDGGSSPLLWKTTAGDNKIELWANGGSSQSNNGGLPITAQNGTQWVELNANSVGALYQDVTTLPGQVLQWSVWHRARGLGNGNTTGQDVMQVQIGTTGSQSPQVPTGQSTASISDGPLAWVNYTGLYNVPAGQTTTRFQFAAISTASGNTTVGNFIDNLTLGNSPCLSAASSSINLTSGAGGLTRPGDTLQYTVTTTNNGGAASGSSTLINAIPAGTTYVPGSLTVGGTAVTDQAGDDTADFSGTAVTARLGSGATATAGGSLAVAASVAVTFKVQVNATVTAGTAIAEVATINYIWPPSVSAISSLSSTTTNAVNTTSIALVKSVDSIVDVNSNGRVDVNDQVKYAFKVTNTGSAALTSVAVTDNKAGTVSCPTTTLAAGALVICTATYTAKTADAAAGGIVNTATAAGTPPSSAARITSAPSSVTTPMYVASLNVTTTPSSPTFSAVGQNTAFTTTVTNGGNSVLSDVTLGGALTAPAGPNPDSAECTVGLPTILAPGDSFSCTSNYAAKQADLDNGKIVGTFNATGTPPTGADVTASGTVTVTTVASPSLTVLTTATPTRVTAAGQVIGYSFAVTNTGNLTITSISITDTFTAPAGPVPTITCTATTLAPGVGTTCTAANYTVLAADIAAGGVVNSATANGTSSHGAAVVSAVSTVPVIAAPPIISFAPAPGEVAVLYSQQPTITGGDGPFTWTISAGSLPGGVTINASTGLVSGTPTASGNFTVTIRAADARSVATAAATLVITALPTLTFTAPAAGKVGVAYSATFTVSGGTSPLIWSTTGTLPPGVTLNTATGVFSGTPTTAGTYAFTVSVVDAYGKTASKAVSLVIAAGPLVIVQTANNNSPVAGSTVGYTITVTNTGTTTFSGITLSNSLAGVLDDAAYNSGANATAGTLTYSAPTLGWSGSLVAGATATITYSVTVNNPDLGNRILASTVTSPTLGTNCASGSGDTRCTATINVAGLSIVKTADVATTTPGSVVHFSVVITNTGQSVYTGATFTDSLAGALDDAVYNADATTSAGGSVTYTSPSLMWTGNLAGGASATITYSVTIANPDTGNKSLTGTIVSTSAGSSCPSGSPAATCSVIVTVLLPGLTITTTAGGATTTPGAVVPLSTTISNTGQTPYTATSVTLALSGAVDDAVYNNDVSASSGSVVYNSTNNTLIWTGNLAIGAVAVTITASMTVLNPDPGDKALVTVASSSAPGSTCPAGNSSPACTATVQVLIPALTITKAANVSSTTPGSVVQYTVSVTNTGQTNYTGATFVDALGGAPAVATYNNNSASATAGAVSVSSPTLTWTGDLPIGATATITYSVTVNPTVTLGLALTGAITSPTAGSNCAAGSLDPRCTSSVPVLIPALSIVTSVDAATTTPGSVVHYTISVANTGQTTYTNVSIGVDLNGVFDDANYNNDGTTSTGSLVLGSGVSWVLSLAPAGTATGTVSFTVNSPPTGDRSMLSSVSSSAPGSSCPTGSSAPTCHTTTIVQIPGLTITKTANASTVDPGGVVTYTIAVKNTGESTYAAATFTDSLADVLHNAVYSGGATTTSGAVSYAAPTISWSGSLAPGVTATITYSVTTLDTNSIDRQITNTVVSPSAGSNCGSGSTDSACSAIATVLVPQLTIVKTANVATTSPGAKVVYTVKATNTGDSPYGAAAYADSLTGALNDASYDGNATVTGGGGTVSYAGSAVSWTGALAVGAAVTVTYSMTVNAADVGNDLVTTTVSSATKGNNCAAGSSDARCTTTVPVARLIIAKSLAIPATTTPGSVVSLVGTFTNTGQVAYTGITVSSPGAGILDDVVANGDQHATSGTLVADATAITWTGDIPVGGTITITGTVTVLNPDLGDKVITSPWVSTAPGNNCPAGSGDARCTVRITVLIPGLTVSKSANVVTVVPGGTVGYTVTIHNGGQTTYAAATVTDSLTGVLDDATFVGTPTASAGTAGFSDPNVTWSGPLAMGDTVTITYSVTVRSPDPGDKSMVSTVSSAAAGSSCLPASGKPACSNTVGVLTPALTIVKTANQSTTTLGTTVAFTITATNVGQTDYANAAFTDSLVGVLDDATYNANASATRGGASFTSPTLSWSGALTQGQFAVITYTVTVRSPDSGNLSLTNTVVSTTAGNNCVSGSLDTRCTATVAVTNAASVTITKTADVASAVAGGTVRFTVAVVNASSAPVTAGFTDPLADIIDDATYNTDAAATGGGTVSYAAPNLTWSGTVPAGGTASISYTVTVRTGLPGDEILTGTIVSGTPPASNNCLLTGTDTRCTATVTVTALLIEQHYTETSTTPGSLVHLHGTFTNVGKTTYQGITISSPIADTVDDAIPTGDQTATSGTLVLNTTAITWTGDIAPGGVVTIFGTLTVKNPDPAPANRIITGTLSTTAMGSNCPPAGTDPLCTALVNVKVPGLTISVTGSPPATAAGGTVTYTVTMANSGETPYTGAVVTNSLAGLLDHAGYNTDAAMTIGTGVLSFTSPNLTWTGDIAVGSTARFTYTVTTFNPASGDKTMVNVVTSTAVGNNCLPASGDPACRSTVVVLTPALTIVKTASLATANLGSTVTYTVVVTNTGQTAYAPATFSDSLAAVIDDATYQADPFSTGGGTFDYTAGVLTWSGTLVPGATTTITYSVTVKSPSSGNRIMTNTVVSTAAGNNCLSGSTDTRCTATVAITNSVALIFTKSADVATTVTSGIVHYTSTVTNSSTAAISSVNLTDSLTGILDDATYNTDVAVIGGGTAAYADPNVTWTGTVAAGATITVTYSVTVRTALTGNELLVGTLTSTTLPASNNCLAGSLDPRCSLTVRVAAMVIAMTSPESTTTPGSVVSFSTTYTNAGQVAYTGITTNINGDGAADDAVGTGDQFASSGTLTVGGNGASWTGDIPVGGVITLTGTATILSPDLGNQVMTVSTNTTTPGSNCPLLSADTRCAVAITVLTPGLTITKTASATSVIPGGVVGYTITVHNTGQTAYTGASFTDLLAGVLNDATYDGNVATDSGNVGYTAPTVSWSGNLAIGATATITYSVTVNDPDTGGKIMTNTVTSTTVGSTCTAASKAGACSATVLVLTPALTIVKSANVTSATLGSTVTYKVVVTNSGQTDYPTANFSDDLAGVLDDAVYNAGATTATTGTPAYAGGVLTWSGALAKGAAATITYTVTVGNPATGNKIMSDKATSTTSGSNCAAASADTRCTVVVSVVNAVLLTFVKTANVLTTAAGDVVNYTVAVTNSGTEALTGVNFTDPLAGIIDDAAFSGTATASSGTATYTNPNLAWTGNVAAGATVTVTYSVTVNTAITGDQILSGTVTSTTLTSADNNCIALSTGPQCTSTVPVARLLITQHYLETSTTPGSVINLSATFTNTGKMPYDGITIASPNADTLDDAIPNGDQTASTGTLVLSAAAITWTGNIPIGGVVTIAGTLTVQNPDPGNKTIVGKLASTAPGNNCPSGSLDPACTASSTVLVPGLTITTATTPGAVGPGGTESYTVTVTNSGQTAYTAVSVAASLTGILDDANYNVDAVAKIGGVDVGGVSFGSSTLAWTGNLALLGVATITFSVTAKDPDPGDKIMIMTVSSSAVGSTCLPASGSAGCSATAIVLTPALTIVSTASVTRANLGNTVTYTVQVTNNGQIPYAAAAFSSSLAGVTDDATYGANATATTGGTPAYSGGVLSWSGALNPTQVATITYSVTINSPSTGNLSLSNTIISANSGNNCLAGSLDTRCSTVVTVTNALSLTFSKTANVATTVGGAVVIYTVTAVNASGSTIIAANFTDPLAGIIDDAVFGGTATASSGTATYTDPNLSWTGDIPAGGVVTVTYSVTVNVAITGDQILLGTLSSTSAPGSDNCLAGSIDPRCTSSVSIARLLLAYGADQNTTPGAVVTFTATFTNTGEVPYVGISVAALAPTAADDGLPGTQTASSGTLTIGQTGAVWTGDIAVGATITLSAQMGIPNPDPGDHAISAKLESAAPGNNCPAGTSDPVCSVSITVLEPGLTISKAAITDITGEVEPGGIVTYTVTIHNSGQTAYTAVTVTDTLTGVLDDATYNNNATASAGAVNFASSALTWTGDLALLATVTFTYTVTAHSPDPGDKIMASTVSSPAAGSSCLPASGKPVCSNTVVVLTPALTIVKTADQTTTTLGSTVAFTATVTNTGQTAYSATTFTRAVFTDSLAGVLDDATYNANAAADSGAVVVSVDGVLSWSGDLNIGQAAVITYSVTVLSADDAGNLSLTNTVVSTTAGNNCASGSPDARCTATVAVTNAASVTITKTADVASTVAGDTVRFTVAVVNASTAPIASSFTDPLADIIDDATYNTDAVAVGGGTVTYTAPNLEWSGTVPAGGTASITYTVTVLGTLAGTEILTGKVVSGTPAVSNNCLSNSTDTRCTATVPVAALRIVNSASVVTTTPGSVVRLTTTFTNTGQVPYIGISIVSVGGADLADDTVPNGDQTVTSGSIVNTETAVVWTGNVLPGVPVTMTGTLTVLNPDPGNKILSAGFESTAAGNNCPPGGLDSRCKFSVAVLIPALDITKSGNTPFVVPGGTASYTIVITNIGTAPYTAATVTDSLVGVLDDATYNTGATADTGSLSYTSPTLTWTGDLAVAAVATITYSVTALSPATGDKVMSNTVTSAAAGSTCPPASSNAACRVTIAVLTPALTITSTVNAATTVPGAPILYTIVATNTGQTVYPTASLTIGLGGVLDDATYSGGVSATSGTVEIAGSTLTWTGPLNPGEAATITYTVVVVNLETGNDRLEQTVTSAVQGNNCPVAGTDSRCTTSVLIASLRILNTADVTTTKPTGVVHVTVVVTNTGQVPYVGITVRDLMAGTLDDAVGNGDSSATSGSLALVVATVSVDWTGDLAPGASVTITGSMTVKNPDPGDKTMTTKMVTTAPGSNCPAGGTDPACATSVTVLIPALTISQVADATSTTPGTTVGYTVTISNAGPTGFTAAHVSDSLAGALSDATYNNDATADSGTPSYSAPVLTWIGDLVVGQSVIVHFTVKVNNPDLGDKVLVNQLISDELGSNCPTGGSAPACTSVVTVQVPALNIAVAADRTTTVPGGVVGYTITVHNGGQTAYSGASVIAALSGVLDDAGPPVGLAATAGVVGFGATNITWSGDLVTGATAIVTYSLTVADPNVGDHALTTSVSSAQPGSTCTSGIPCVNTVTVLIPGLAVSTTANVATGTPGDQVVFTITIANTGQTPYVGTTVSTDLSDITDDATVDGAVSATLGVASYTAPTLSWTGSLPVGITAIVSYSVTIRSPDLGDKLLTTTVVAPAAGSACKAGSSSPACTDSVTVLIPGMTIIHSANVATTTPGGVVTYTIVITNTGQTDYVGAVVSESLSGLFPDAVYSGGAAVTGGGSLDYTAPVLTWTGGLLIGGIVTITYSVTVLDPDPGDKSMTNGVTSTTPGNTCPPANTVPACSSLVRVLVPQLLITKTANTTSVVAGSPVNYTITVTNAGETDYAVDEPATFTDPLAGVLDDAVYVGNAVATVGTLGYADSTLSWSGALAVGTSSTITYSVTTNFPATGSGLLTNAVVSPAPGSSCVIGTNLGCSTEVTVLVPELTIAKTADASTVVNGSVIQYTVTATNTGDADYSDAGFTDSLASILDHPGDLLGATATSGEVSIADDILSWSGALPVGGIVVVVYTAEVDLATTGDTTFINVVESATLGNNCGSGSLDENCSTSTTILAQTLTLSGLTPSFTLTGPAGTTVSQNGVTTMTVTTNVPGGYKVTVKAAATGLVGTGGNLETIPIGKLGVRETGTNLFQAVSATSWAVHEQNTPSAPDGDLISNDYQIEIPFVAPDTYSTTLEYIVIAQ